MKFTEITREDERRVLCYRPLPQGAEIAICLSVSNGDFEPCPEQKTVEIPRTTRRWIGHALSTLLWKKEDFELVTATLRDPRLEMYHTHPARNRVLAMPNHVMPQDGYRQLGSVWSIEGQGFAACISEDANQPEWWGDQIAGLMVKIVSGKMQDEMDRKTALSIVLTGYENELRKPPEDMALFASRYDWFNARRSFEAISIWVAPGNEPLALWRNDLFDEPYWWGVACASLTHEVVETLWVEREEQRQAIIEALTPPYFARLAEAQVAFEKEGATVQ